LPARRGSCWAACRARRDALGASAGYRWRGYWPRYVTCTIRIKRAKRIGKKTVKSAVADFVITSPDAREVAWHQIAHYARGHWTIENKVHWVRDVIGEDASRIRTGSRPRVMITLRNLAIGLIR
jgi:hypothetical protein